MEIGVKFLLLAELVSQTTDGKLNIMGIFDGFEASTLPLILPQIQVVGRLEASHAAGDTHSAQLKVTDEDGAVIYESPIVPLQFLKALKKGWLMRADVAFRIGGLSLPNAGDYSVALWIDGIALGTARLNVTLSEVA